MLYGHYFSSMKIEETKYLAHFKQPCFVTVKSLCKDATCIAQILIYDARVCMLTVKKYSGCQKNVSVWVYFLLHSKTLLLYRKSGKTNTKCVCFLVQNKGTNKN